VESDTEQFRFRHNQVLPALDDPPPILIGGHSDPALRRAARLGDGWVSAPCAFDEIARVVEQLATERRSFGREEGSFVIRTFLGAPPSSATFESLADLGVSSVVLPQYLISDQPDSFEAVLDGISSISEMIRSWSE
jgi:alkanesulfonate monooxygenase SsuD/methylene tetrahydromethanopterin reductase-like flavin-dependent oxidoreductase (luciferase family)